MARELSGRVKLEDAGFDWKLLGPDVQEVDYVAWVCDQDAYAYRSGNGEGKGGQGRGKERKGGGRDQAEEGRGRGAEARVVSCGVADGLTCLLFVCVMCALSVCVVPSGQKCSAQSILFMHQNWVQAGLPDKLKVPLDIGPRDLRHRTFDLRPLFAYLLTNSS